MNDPEFIVGEVSKNWPDPTCDNPGAFVCGLFETLINVNLQRGYMLHSFQFHQLMTGQQSFVETIIAVFRRQQRGPSSN